MKINAIWEALPWKNAPSYDLRRDVCLALENLPDDVVEFVIDYILFACVEPENGRMISSRCIGRRDVIVLPYGEEGPTFQRTILHEIAHSWKGHHDTSHNMDKDLHHMLYEAQEKEARDTVEMWKEMKEHETR